MSSAERVEADPSNIVVIVTGGARGLGRAMTLALIRNGFRAAAADLPASAAELRELKDIARAEGLQDRLLSVEFDVTQWQDCIGAVNKTIDRFGAVPRPRQQCRCRNAAYRKRPGRSPRTLL